LRISQNVIVKCFINWRVLKLVKIKTRISDASYIQGVSPKTLEPNISVICQRIFMKFKMQIFWAVKIQLITTNYLKLKNVILTHVSFIEKLSPVKY
jgi:hypothetical protein